MQPLLAFHGKPYDAVRGKNQLFVQQALYRNAFEGKKARHILFVYALARAIDDRRLALKAKSNASALIAVEQKQLSLLRDLNFKPFLIAVIARSLEVFVGSVCDPVNVGFKPVAAQSTVISELAARWLPVVETVLPFLTAIVDPDSFYENLGSDPSYLDKVKAQLDAFLVAARVGEQHKTFAELVAAT